MTANESTKPPSDDRSKWPVFRVEARVTEYWRIFIRAPDADAAMAFAGSDAIEGDEFEALEGTEDFQIATATEEPERTEADREYVPEEEEGA